MYILICYIAPSNRKGHKTIMFHKVKNKTKSITIDFLFKLGLPGILPDHKGGCILMYHGIDLVQNTTFNGRFIGVKQFEEQLRHFKKHFRVLSLTDYLCRPRKDDSFSVALTFDDGYLNNYKYAKPLLEKYEIPATIFVTGANPLEKDILWADLLDIGASLYDFPLEINGEVFKKNHNEYYSLRDEVKLKNKIIDSPDPHYYDLVTEVLTKHFSEFKNDPKYDDYWQLMSDEQIVECAQSPFIEIGGHSFEHYCLGHLPFDYSRDQILKSIFYLENLIQKKIISFSYPNGSYTEQLVEFSSGSGIINQVLVNYKHNKHRFVSGIIDRFGVYPGPSVPNSIRYIMRSNNHKNNFISPN